jgi:plastocyanin
MRRLTVTLAASALLLAGCSSSGNSSSGNSSSGTATATTGSATTSSAAVADTIVIKNFSFRPSTLTVAPGAKVTVTNEDAVTHTVTSSAFNTGDVGPGATLTFTAPTKAGTYPYICSIHTYMHGSLTVS